MKEKSSGNTPQLHFTKKWNILLLTAFEAKIKKTVEKFGDIVIIPPSEMIVSKDYIIKNDIDLIICFGYGHILTQDVLKIVTAINVHSSYLPFNRGPNPNLWAWMDGTPHGVSIHYIDAGIDTGDIIAQKKIHLEESSHSLESSFQSLIDHSSDFFDEVFSLFRAGKTDRIKQKIGGSQHRLSDQQSFAHLFSEEGLNMPINKFVELAKLEMNQTSE